MDRNLVNALTSLVLERNLLFEEALTELMNISLQAPTSRNALMSARYGKAIQNLRYQLSNTPGMERLTVEPHMGGQSLATYIDVDTPDLDWAARETGLSRADVAKEIKHNYIIKLEPANSKLAGIPGQAAIFSHEAGHLLAGHVDPTDRKPKPQDQAAVDHEIEANTIGDAFAQHVGLDVNKIHQNPNLNTYRDAHGLPLEPLTPEEEEYAKNRKKVKAAAKEKDWPGTYAIGKHKFAGNEPRVFLRDITSGFIQARKNRKKV
jgi:hypothetical protein